MVPNWGIFILQTEWLGWGKLDSFCYYHGIIDNIPEKHANHPGDPVSKKERKNSEDWVSIHAAAEGLNLGLLLGILESIILGRSVLKDMTYMTTYMQD